MIKLGDKVKDTITDFEGVAVAKIIYLNGCIRYEVKPKGLEEGVKRGLRLLFNAGIKPYRITVMFLCNYNTSFEEDLYRYNELDAFGVIPFVMVHGKPSKELKHFARWVDKRWLCQAVPWEEYYKGVHK